MSRIRISVEAHNDIDEIAKYSVHTWGWRQADAYLTRIEECLEQIAANPGIGRSCDQLRAGLRRFEVGRHVLFYAAETDGIFVIRVLHQRMLPLERL
ncbi:type II toxin-antitoxin system RelE/ParE family toxin [Acidobacteria bacterium AB60]|nr:type II toxin-antitoxin system RelE/ParE family toxin [Acidobacteria bacterium AB60]